MNLFFLIIAGIISGGCLAVLFGSMVAAMRIRRWPQVQGEITGNKPQTETDVNLCGNGIVVNRLLVPKIKYRYQVDGKNYTGHEITFITLNDTAGLASRRIRKKYPYGQQVTVYYSPDNPKRSLLEPYPSIFFFLGAGLVALLFALPILSIFF